MSEIVIVNDIRYRREDAERRGLLAAPAAADVKTDAKTPKNKAAKPATK